MNTQMMTSGTQNAAVRGMFDASVATKRYAMARNGSENASVTKLSEKLPNESVSFFS